MFSSNRFRAAALLSSLCLAPILTYAQSSPKAFAKAGPSTARSLPKVVVNSGRDQIMPFVYDGNGWTTMIVLTNLDNHTISVHVQFTANDGTLLSFPVNGIGDASDVYVTIPSGGNYSIVTSGFAAQRTSGYAYVTAQNGTDLFGGYGVARNQTTGLPDIEFTIPFTPLDENVFTLSFDNTAGFSTYAVLINSSSNNASINVSVQDSQGNVLVTDQISLSPFARYVFNLGDVYPVVNGLVGNVYFSASGAQLVAGSGLRQGPYQSFTLIPTLSLPR